MGRAMQGLRAFVRENENQRLVLLQLPRHLGHIRDTILVLRRHWRKDG